MSILYMVYVHKGKIISLNENKFHADFWVDDSLEQFKKLFGEEVYSIIPFVYSEKPSGKKSLFIGNFKDYKEFTKELDNIKNLELKKFVKEFNKIQIKFFNKNLDVLKPYFAEQDKLKERINKDKKKFFDSKNPDWIKSELINNGWLRQILGDISLGNYAFIEM